MMNDLSALMTFEVHDVYLARHFIYNIAILLHFEKCHSFVFCFALIFNLSLSAVIVHSFFFFFWKLFEKQVFSF